MNRKRLSVASAGLALAAGALAFLEPVAAFAAAILAVATIAYGRWRDAQPAGNAALVDELVTRVQHGRQLAIYERETGLLAHWYLMLRGEEECARAQRYGRKLTVLVVEPQSGEQEWLIQGRLTDWLRRDTRNTDLVGYLGNGCFVVVLTETAIGDSDTLIARLRGSIPPTEMGAASFPGDGKTYSELLHHAQHELRARSMRNAREVSSHGDATRDRAAG